MPVKSVQSRKAKVRKLATDKGGHDEDDQPAVLATKTKMPIELDEPDGIPLAEEKSEEELMAAEEESDELGLDDAGLEEELDPFNDKWEA